MDGGPSMRYSQSLPRGWRPSIRRRCPRPRSRPRARWSWTDSDCALSGTPRPRAASPWTTRSPAGRARCDVDRSRRAGPAGNAAFANTMTGRIDLFDDADSLAHVHAGVATVMTALAISEREDRNATGLPGRRRRRHRRRGAHRHDDAAVALRRGLSSHGHAQLLRPRPRQPEGSMGLSESHMLAALGLAAEQASGFTEYRRVGPIEMSALHGARAAMSGVLAADLARAGMPAPPTPLEGPHGFLHTMSPRRDLAPLLDDLGGRFAIVATELKPYPCNRIAHGAIGAAVRLRHDDPRFRAGNVRSAGGADGARLRRRTATARRSRHRSRPSTASSTTLR